MEIMKAKQDVIRAGIELSQSGLIARTWGNVSCRIDEESFVITPSGRSYLTLTPEEIVEVKMADLSYEGNVKPSSEKKIHKEVYRLKKNANFVIHTHQSNASAVSAMGLDKIRFDKEYPGIGSYVIVADYGLPGTKKLCANTAAAIDEYDGKAVIMRSHGALCYGESYEEAFEVARTLEEACGKYLEKMGVSPWKEGTDDASFEEAGLIWNNSPSVMKYIGAKKVLKPYLDDFTQIAGTSLKVIDYSEEAIKKAVSKNRPVLVRGKGALCAAAKKSDAEALSIVIEKNCRAALAAIGCKPINPLECMLMRQVYLNKYSKQSK